MTQPQNFVLSLKIIPKILSQQVCVGVEKEVWQKIGWFEKEEDRKRGERRDEMSKSSKEIDPLLKQSYNSSTQSNEQEEHDREDEIWAHEHNMDEIGKVSSISSLFSLFFFFFFISLISFIDSHWIHSPASL